MVKKAIRSIKYFLLLIFCLFQYEFYSQIKISQTPDFFSCGFYTGVFQVHTKKLPYYKDVKIKGLEVEYSRWLLTDKAKRSFGFYPKWGMGFNYVDFGHKSLGYSINGIAFIEPFFKSRGKLKLSGKVGTGLAYLSNPFDLHTNPLNLTNSTQFAFPLVGGINLYYFFNEHWVLKTSASYRHISNGGIRQPNMGINYAIIGVAIERTLNKYSIPESGRVISISKNNRTEVLAGYSLKTDLESDVKSNVVLLCFNRCFGGGRLNAFSYSVMVEYQQISDCNSVGDQWSFGPLIGNEFLIGDLRFGQQLGVYLLKGTNATNNLFQNYYLRYLLWDRFVVGTNLKTHGRVADYLAFQIGLVL